MRLKGYRNLSNKLCIFFVTLATLVSHSHNLSQLLLIDLCH